MPGMSDHSQRYARQIRFAGLGEAGQRRLEKACVVVVGLGALGSVSATFLARAGVGRLRLVDRDVVDLSNLHRQILYTEADAAGSLPKAVAAAAHLGQANSEVQIAAAVEDLTTGNIDRLLAGADAVVDGTDNFETRFLINEWCVREGVSWVYGAAVGAYGITFPVVPGQTPCLTCVFEEAPPPELSPTCETAGVVGPITGAVASLQAGEVLKILAGGEAEISRALTILDMWNGRVQQVELSRRPGAACPVCGAGRFPHLEAEAGSGAIRLCGRNAVQVSPQLGRAVDLAALASRLQAAGEVTRNRYLVRVQVEGCDLTVFADGRSLVAGTEDPAVARSLVARYVGG